MKYASLIFLSINAGYIDTASFLALHGLFAAHITGNFVTLGMALVSGASGVWLKILAIPVFCLVVFLSKVLTNSLICTRMPVKKSFLLLKLILLASSAFLAVLIDRSYVPNEIFETTIGLLLVSAMALQNTASYSYPNDVSATILTGPITKMMIDVANLFQTPISLERNVVKSRIKITAINVISFAFGCGFSAILFSRIGIICLVVPPIFAILSALVGESE
jgi:uncharacterized membrane protein YoaK (UPF0700 family)